MPQVRLPLDALPQEVFSLLVHFLTGFDLLPLSHVNRRFYHELLAEDSIEWSRRVAYVIAGTSAKQQYCTQRSLLFPGREMGETPQNERGGAVQIPREVQDMCDDTSFSFDTFFALSPGQSDDKNVFTGGILLGAQSVDWRHNWWADSHQQYAHVDTEGNLYCTMMDTKTVVAKDLQLERWYHLALVFDRGQEHDRGTATQRVYLDGKLMDVSTGRIHSEWRWNRHMQVGSGCISGGSNGQPTTDFCGWYGFHGLVDEFCVWPAALSEQQVRRLAEGTDRSQFPLVRCESSMRGNRVGPVRAVRCTRPQERGCTVIGQM